MTRYGWTGLVSQAGVALGLASIVADRLPGVGLAMHERPWVRREGTTLAIAWVRSHPAVTAPLVGARNLDQLAPCLAAAELTLRPELRDEISALSPAPAPATDRNEENSSHNYGAR